MLTSQSPHNVRAACLPPTLEQDGHTIASVITSSLYTSEFDQYGKMKVFSAHLER